MAGSSNFLQWDSGGTNATNDTDYAASSTRTAGFVTGIAPSALFNKVLLQQGTMSYALGQVMLNAGEVVVDSNAANLINSLARTFVSYVGSVSKTANYTIVAADKGSIFQCTGTFTFTMTAPATLGTTWICFIHNNGTGIVTVSPAAAETFDGRANLVLGPQQSIALYTDGTNFFTRGLFRFPKRYRNSAVPVWASTTTLTVAYVAERDGTDVADIGGTGPYTVSVGSTGLNALDAGTVATNTWYYLYAVTNGTTVGLMLSTVNESVTGSISAANYAYTYKRQLPFAIRTDGSAHILPFQVGEGWPYNPTVLWMTTMTNSSTVAAGVTSIINAGAATSFTTISAASFIPPISNKGLFGVLGTGSTSDIPAIRTSSTLGNVVTTWNGGPYAVALQTTASQQIDYEKFTGTGTTSIDVLGFIVNLVP